MSNNHDLRKRCPQCKKRRKFREPDGNCGGRDHPRRKPWDKINGVWVCGWCAGTPTGQPGPGTVARNHEPRSKYVPMKLMYFKVNETEQATFDAWSAEHVRACRPQKTDHTRWAITFTRTGIGDCITVKCLLCDTTKNITDYSSW